MNGLGLVHCIRCQHMIPDHVSVCPYCGQTHASTIRVKKRVMKIKEISPRSYVLFVIIMTLVMAVGTYFIFSALNDDNAVEALVLLCSMTVVIAALFHFIAPKSREYSYYS